MIFAAFFAIFFFTVSIASAEEKCGFMCDFTSEGPLLIDAVKKNLEKPGPAKGYCAKGQIEWVINGAMFRKPNKCCCLEDRSKFQKSSDRYKDEVYRCPDVSLALPTDTIVDFVMKNLALNPPQDGWCSTGKLKYIHKLVHPALKVYGNVCLCYNAYQIINFTDYKKTY